MNRAFTTREKVLILVLAVLLVGCCYYLLILKPSMDTIASSEANLRTVQTEIAAQQIVAAQKIQLEKQIADAQASGATQRTLPAYDNTKNEINELNNILASATSYNINFSDPQIVDTLARRQVDLSFTCDTYAAANTVLVNLVNCQYTCLLTDISISGSNLGQASSTSRVTASATITFFEKLG